jgi:hypothetical protein
MFGEEAFVKAINTIQLLPMTTWRMITGMEIRHLLCCFQILGNPYTYIGGLDDVAFWIKKNFSSHFAILFTCNIKTE